VLKIIVKTLLTSWVVYFFDYKIKLMTKEKQPQHMLFEAGKMHESGYGNSLLS